MAEKKWTPQQQDAISARGGTLLVSAAAGSGKTAVLVERVIERLTDPVCPTDADRLLVVTFTKAAAAEMSGRISARIAQLLEQDPSSIRLQRQQVLLTRAHISTIHSFCSDLIRENFYKLGVAPDFRILEESEMQILRAEAADEALEEAYAQQDPVFAQLVEAFSSTRDDKRLVDMIFTLYDFVRSHPFPKRWLKEKAELYHADVPAGQTPWGEKLFAFAADALDYALSLTRNSLEQMKADEKINTAYEAAFFSDLNGLQVLREKAKQKQWDALFAGCSNFSFEKLKPLRGYADDPLKNQLSASRKEVKAAVEKIGKLLGAEEEACGEEIAALSPLVERLFVLTTRFGDFLDAKKAERRAADFSDLEHWALRLLVQDTGGQPEFTEEAKELQNQFDEIMVDEYQDTNEAQDMIFQAVSKNGSNLFLVGDVKQSIYSFRQAMPQIFLNRRAAFVPYDRGKDEYPASISLDRNFRSRKGVTETVNFVFRQLMSRQTGDLDYDEQEELKAGASYPPADFPAAQLDIVDLSSVEDEREMVQAESRHLAEVIYELLGSGMQVTVDGITRPVGFSDICILLRSANKWASVYARELQRMGIPAWADTAGGFFAAPEVAVVLSFLRVIDNPLQDIPLLAVLMSPIYGFTADEMAPIRTPDVKLPLYLALKKAAENGTVRVQSFLKEMEELRTLAATLPADRLVRILYERTGYADMVQAMQNGELRLANLRLLLEYARKYEASGYGGISGFLRFVDRLERRGGDLPAASTVRETADVVRLMSIHRSKGLEFPVCILAGCSRRFNKERGDVLLHPELGFGAKLKDVQTGSRVTTLPREATALEIDRAEMSEELRVLYVAMTRAKEKLILVTTVKDAVKTLGKLAPRLTEEPRLQPYVVRSVSNISDWLLLCALRHPDGGRLRELAGALPGVTLPCEETWQIRLLRPEDLPDETVPEQEKLPVVPKPEQVEALQAPLLYQYPYVALQGVQSKVAASELAAQEFSQQYAASSRPAFLSAKGLTPAERGTALHAFLQFANYKAACEAPEQELERLTAAGFITQEQAGAVDLERIRAFFQSAVARRMLQAERMEREYRFTVEIPARRVKPQLEGLPEGEEPVVLQGAMDCVFEENGGLVIVDYKTDHTKDTAALWERYKVQLGLYKQALEQCTGLQVKECLLYSFYLNRQISGVL